jgi:hypothetical protein
MAKFRNELLASGLSEAEAKERVASYKFTPRAIEEIAAKAQGRTVDDIRAELTEYIRLVGDKRLLPEGFTFDFFPRILHVDRPSYIKLESSIHVGKAGFGKSSVFHEMAHHLEFVDRDISRASKAFVEARGRYAAKGKEPEVRLLSDLYPEGTYGPLEKTMIGRYVNEYTGKRYDVTDPMTELVTTGLENFITPQAMVELYRQDPEHFLYILGLIRR